jgi:hypothetical protein
LNFRRTLLDSRGSKIAELKDCSELDSWVRGSSFTFVIGPGCARVGWDKAAITLPVAAAMARLFLQMDVNEDREFFACLAASYSMDLTIDTEAEAVSEVEFALDPIRQNLVTIARLTTEQLSAALGHWRDPIIDWEHLNVSLGRNHSRGRILTKLEGTIQRLTDLDEQCRGVQTSEDWRRASSRDWDDLRDVFGIVGIRESLKQLYAHLENDSPLTGGNVEWLTNLVWHSFRYAAPWPPSTDELAFQLGITWDQARLMESPEPAHATQGRFSQADAGQTLRRVYEIASRSERTEEWEDRSRLFKSVARLAVRPLDRPAHSVTKDLSEQLSTDEALLLGKESRMLNEDAALLLGIERHGNAFPIILSSSFDNLLETEVLELLRDLPETKLHTIVPVLVPDAQHLTADISWVLGTARPDQHVVWTLLEPGTPPPPFGGPVIVKLNGDPQAGPAVISGTTTSIEPLVVLTEFQHLSLLMAENSLFEMLMGRLPKMGCFILLGESVDEWSIRQRLFGQTMQTFWSDANSQAASRPEGLEEESTRNFVQAISINRRVDSLRHSLFSWVNIRPYRGDLAQVATMLTEIVRNLPKSPSGGGDPVSERAVVS